MQVRRAVMPCPSHTRFLDEHRYRIPNMTRAGVARVAGPTPPSGWSSAMTMAARLPSADNGAPLKGLCSADRRKSSLEQSADALGHASRLEGLEQGCVDAGQFALA